MNFKKDGVSKDNLLSLMAKEMDVSDWPSDAEWAVCATEGYDDSEQNKVLFVQRKPPVKDGYGRWTILGVSGALWNTRCDFYLSEIPYDWYNATVSREQFMQAKQSIGSKENTKMKEPVRTQRKFGDYVDNSKLTEAELRVFIDDAEAMGFGNDNDEAGYPFTGILGDCVGGRLGSITSDDRGNDVTHEYQGLSQQWQGKDTEDVHENVITETGVYRGRDGGHNVVIHHIDYDNGVAFGFDTADNKEEKYCVKSGDRFEFNYDRYQDTGVDRKDSQRNSLSGHVHTTPSPRLTPAQEQGWAVGDIGIVKANTGFMKAGSVVELHHDDASLCPQFEDLSSDATEFHYGNLSDIVHIGTKQQFLDMFFDTPAKRQGFGLDVYGIVNQENSGTIDAGSVVSFYEDSYHNDIPLWKVLVGNSRYNCCDGQQGAFEYLNNITKINLTADLYDKLS